MGSVLASTIISGTDGLGGVRKTVFDTDSANYRYSDVDLLSLLNDGQRFVVWCIPSANTGFNTFQLQAGTFQIVPIEIYAIIDVLCNMGLDGSAAGASITLIKKDVMDQINPNWRTDTADATVQHWMFDEKNPTNFEVYPAQPAVYMGYIQAVLSTTPDMVEDATEAITIPDIYQSAIQNYITYRLYAIQNDALSLQMAQTYYNLCVTELGRKDLIGKGLDPNKPGGK
jgi:hypothetical protein